MDAVFRAAAIPRRLARPIQQFLATESAGGVLLLMAAGAALLWANLDGTGYANFWSSDIPVGGAVGTIDEPLVGWVNDALMTVFFLVVGLEIRREVTRGELRDRRTATLPLAAALGGMIAPALIYLAINEGTDGVDGWGIPMATDIAFAVGALSLLGTRVPPALKVFLLALAIVDDVGAIVVIAVYYADAISIAWIAGAFAMLGLVVAFGRLRLRHVVLFAAIGLSVWIATYESGVHPTIAGVALAFALPDWRVGDADNRDGERALERAERLLHPWTGFLIVPVFALANAGVSLRGAQLHDAATSRVAIGVALGLVIGKPAGIMLFTFATVRAGLAILPDAVSWQRLFGAAMIAGMGFTVSLFIGGLAFRDPALIDEAKIAILAASTFIGVVGGAFLWLSASNDTGPSPESADAEIARS